MAVAQETKPAKKASASKKSKVSPSHPPYIEMITKALVALKERTGSSHYAIAKHIEEQQKVRELPSNFKKLLSVQLKRLVASGKLVKVKNSFKLPPVVAKKSAVLAVVESKPKKVMKKEVTRKSKAATISYKSKAKKEKTLKAKSPVKRVSAVKKIGPAKAKKPKSVKSPVKKSVTMKKIAATKKAKK